MPTKTSNEGMIKEFQPWIFLLGGLFSLGVIYGTLRSSITDLELFESDAKTIHSELNEKSILRHEKGINYTNEKFKELREVIRVHGTKTDLMHVEVIKLTTTSDIMKDDVKSIKNLLIKMNENKNKGH